jgi:CIC family chloride channel protein
MIGGSFGWGINHFFPSITADPGAYATVGVGSFLASVTHAPLTGIFLLFEMTGNYEIIIPVMIASIIGALVSKVINYDSIDTVELSRKGIDLHGGKELAIMTSIKVREVMDTSFQTIHEDKDLNDLTELILMGKNFYFPVVDDDVKLKGIISLQDIKGALFEEDLRDIVKVGNASSKKVFTLKPSDDLQKAVELLTKRDIKEIPVVSEDDDKVVIGMLRRDDIMGAYQKEVLKRKVEGFI